MPPPGPELGTVRSTYPASLVYDFYQLSPRVVRQLE